MRWSDAIILLVLWTVVVRRWRQRRRTALHESSPAARQAEPRPLVSIVVPARNEAARIERCVRSLLAQSYKHLEVIVVDDGSEDGTAAIVERLAAEDARLRLVRGAGLPDGWMGKAFAAVQGYERAVGEWLLFTDADTAHAPWLLSAAIARIHETPASFATTFGVQHDPSALAHLVSLAAHNYVFLTLDRGRFENPRSPTAVVNGQYVLFARRAYEAVGTHAALRWFSSTDVSLGYLAKLQGWMPLFLDAGDGLTTTMFPSAGAAFLGWSRILANGMWTYYGRTMGSLVMMGVALGMTALWAGPWAALWRGVAAASPAAIGVAALELLAGALVMTLQLRSWRRALPGLVAMPVSSAILIAAAGVGVIQGWRRNGMIWKGRIVRTTARLPRWRPAAPRPR
jgi:chlorobactene glucosyltransferase